MADEFERVISLMLDRMETKIRDIEACNSRIDGFKKSETNLLDRINQQAAAFHKECCEAEYIKQKLHFANERLAARNAEDKKLSELWQAADTIRSKKNNDVTAADRQRLAKALDDAQSACDQIPF